jgi:hypothetical protein
MAINFTKESNDIAFSTARPVTWRPGRPLAPIVRPIDINNRLSQLAAGSGAQPAKNTDTTLPTGTPDAPLSVSATQQPYKIQGRTVSLVSVSFSLDPSDTNYDHVNIWFKGYEGSSDFQEIAQGRTSPVTFTAESTGETVTIIVQTASSKQVLPLALCPTTTVTLNGVVGAPPAPSINQATIATPTGLQFSFNQEGGLLADVINCYKVYHNTTNTPSTATVYKIYPQDPSNVGGSVVVQETLANGITEYYWVTAVNTTGLESAKTAAGGATSGSQLTGTGQLVSADQIAASGVTYLLTPQFPGGEIVVHNGNFEASTALPVPGWIASASSLTYETVSPQSGSRSLKVHANVQFGAAASEVKWRINPGDIIYVNGFIRSDGTSFPVIQMNFIDANGNDTGTYVQAFSGDGLPIAWTQVDALNTAPANAVYMYITLQNNHASGTGDCYFDNVWAARVKPLGKEVSDGNDFYMTPYVTVAIVDNAAYNGSFELFPSTQTVAQGWTKNFETIGAGFTYSRSTTANVGSFSQGITNNGGGASVASRPFTVKGNLNYQFEFYARSTVANPGTMYGRVLWYNSSASFTRFGANLISYTDIVAAGGPTSANVFQSFSAEVVAPATAKYAVIALYNWSGTHCTILFDGVAWALGTFDPSTGLIAAKGGISPYTNPGFTYTSTSSSITWAWSGLKIYRADNTITTVVNSTRQTTGLGSSTTYYSYPYYDDSISALKFANGASGSTGEQFTAAQRSNAAVQQQNLNSRIALSFGSMSAATVAPAAPPGGGSGGGSGGCVRHNMLVEEKTKGIIPAYQVEKGDWLKTPEGDGWTEVVFAEPRPESVFIRLTVQGHSVEVAPTTPFNAMDENCQEMSVEAARVNCMTQLFTRTGADFVEEVKLNKVKEDIKMYISCSPSHLFYAGEDSPFIVTHNLMKL